LEFPSKLIKNFLLLIQKEMSRNITSDGFKLINYLTKFEIVDNPGNKRFFNNVNESVCNVEAQLAFGINEILYGKKKLVFSVGELVERFLVECLDENIPDEYRTIICNFVSGHVTSQKGVAEDLLISDYLKEALIMFVQMGRLKIVGFFW
jgi:hypothetical protein